MGAFFCSGTGPDGNGAARLFGGALRTRTGFPPGCCAAAMGGAWSGGALPGGPALFFCPGALSNFGLEPVGLLGAILDWGITASNPDLGSPFFFFFLGCSLSYCCGGPPWGREGGADMGYCPPCVGENVDAGKVGRSSAVGWCRPYEGSDEVCCRSTGHCNAMDTKNVLDVKSVALSTVG